MHWITVKKVLDEQLIQYLFYAHSHCLQSVFCPVMNPWPPIHLPIPSLAGITWCLHHSNYSHNHWHGNHARCHSSCHNFTSNINFSAAKLPLLCFIHITQLLYIWYNSLRRLHPVVLYINIIYNALSAGTCTHHAELYLMMGGWGCWRLYICICVIRDMHTPCRTLFDDGGLGCWRLYICIFVIRHLLFADNICLLR